MPISHRYSVVFTGEKLPDGRKADAVYIVLNDIYMQVLNGAMTRPLDYDYLKACPPPRNASMSFSAIRCTRPSRTTGHGRSSSIPNFAPMPRRPGIPIGSGSEAR